MFIYLFIYLLIYSKRRSLILELKLKLKFSCTDIVIIGKKFVFSQSSKWTWGIQGTIKYKFN